MKKIFLIAALHLAVTSIAQTTTKQQDIQKLLVALQIKPAIQNMVNEGISLYQKQKPQVPQKVWEDIKNKLDYTPYLTTVTAIFNDNYTQPEIKHLITLALNARPGKQPVLKPAVKTLLYKAGNEFGKQFATLINQQLKMKGY